MIVITSSASYSIFFQVMSSVVKECKKENTAYRLNALRAAATIIAAWKVDRFEELKPVIEKLLNHVSISTSQISFHSLLLNTLLINLDPYLKINSFLFFLIFKCERNNSFEMTWHDEKRYFNDDVASRQYFLKNLLRFFVGKK